MEKSRKMRPLLAGATALLFSAGLLAGGVANAAQPGYNAYTAADNQLTQAMDDVNGSIQAKNAADAQAAQDAANAATQQAQTQAQAVQPQASSSGTSTGSYGSDYSHSGYRAPSYAPQQYYRPSAPAAPSVPFKAHRNPEVDPNAHLPSCSNIPADGKVHDCM